MLDFKPILSNAGKDRAMQRCNPSVPEPCGESRLDPVRSAGAGRQAEESDLPVRFFPACHPLKMLHTGSCDKPVFVREKGG